MPIRLPKIETFKVEPPECMSMEQVAGFLGVSVPFIRRNLDQIPHKRIGTRVLFGRRAVLDWLNNPPKQEPKKDE